MVNARPPRGGSASLWRDTNVEWRVTPGLQDYAEAVRFMEQRAEAIRAGSASELVWLLEHPPLYTAGTSARPDELVAARFPVFPSGRGGRFTYHGPGQRVAYLMLDLKARGMDVRAYVMALEDWIIRALARFGVAAERRCDRVGVWVPRPERGDGHEDKIAAIGVRVRRWVTLHGISINVAPDLSHYSGIVPCGIQADPFGVTSLQTLGRPAAMAPLDEALRAEFETIFGPTADAAIRDAEPALAASDGR